LGLQEALFEILFTKTVFDMSLPHPKAAALASLRQALGSKVRSGSEFLHECEGRGMESSPLRVGASGVEELVVGLRPGRITELLVAGPSRGGGLVLAALLARARREERYAVLFDVGSGFDIGSFPGRDLESLLWIGCDSVEQAVAAFDVAARDENFRWFILDGRDARPEDWRAVRPALWQRIAQPLRERGATGLILSRVPVTGVAKERYELEARFDLEALQDERSRLLASVRVRPARGDLGEGRERLPAV
jgi:hypothetical protein